MAPRPARDVGVESRRRTHGPCRHPHAELVQAMRTWIDHGCGCPEQ
jgi:hypothetical protein